METDVLNIEEVFDGNIGKDVFSKIRQGTLRTNFQKTYDNKKCCLKISPPLFEYNSKIGIHDTVVPEKLKEIVELLKLTETGKKEMNKIKKFLADIEPQIAESDIFDELAIFFCNERGILLHGYQPRAFLKVFVDMAADYRRRSKTKGYQLTDLERKILVALNIQIKEVEAIADEVVVKLKNQHPTMTAFPTSMIHKQINGMNFRHLPPDFKGVASNKFRFRKSYPSKKLHDSKNSTDMLNSEENTSKEHVIRNKKKAPFLKELTYDESEIKEAMMFSIYETESRFPGEWDFLVVLPDHKCIINVEVKNNRDNDSKNSNLRCAAKQLKDHAKYMARVHGVILSEDWSFLKMAAIVPNVVDDSNVCDHCKEFIISNQCSISTVWNNLPMSSVVKVENDQRKADIEFGHLFDRLVHFSSTIQQSHSGIENMAWKQIQGNIFHSISSGYTASDLASNSAPESLPSFSDVRHMPHTASKILYFNPEQIGLLSKRILMFLSDYGSGKLNLLYLSITI